MRPAGDTRSVPSLWDIRESAAVVKEDLDALLAGRIACIRVSGFLRPDWCGRAVERFMALPSPPLKVVDYDGAVSRRLGTVVSETLDEQEAYFAEAGRLDSLIRGLFEDGQDPLPKFRSALEAATGWRTVELSEAGRPYQSDMIWELLPGARVPLHCDATPGWFYPNDAKRARPRHGPPLRIFDYPRLLNWNVYLDAPERGGALRIYDRPSRRYDKVRMGDRSSDSLVAQSRCAALQPRAGDLVILDTNRYHEVTKVEGEGRRVSLHSQIGINAQAGEMVIWI